MRAARSVAALAAVIGVGVLPAIPANADSPPTVVEAVAQARGASQCSPLIYDAGLERAAEIINRSTLTYIDHTAENIPADDPHPMPILEELGIEAKNVHSLQGAGRVEADAIKGLLLQGHKTIPDCTYTEFGGSRLYDPRSGYYFAVALLVQK